MSRHEVYGGAEGVKQIETPVDAIEEMVESSPNTFRVGVTNDVTRRMGNYPKTYDNTTVYYDKVDNAKEAEQKLLDKLGKDHPYNEQKNSNYPEKPGYVYAIDVSAKGKSPKEK